MSLSRSMSGDKRELMSFLMGQTQFSVPLNCYGTEFQRKVWRKLLNTIPFGETRTYKDIASHAFTKGSACCRRCR